MNPETSIESRYLRGDLSFEDALTEATGTAIDRPDLVQILTRLVSDRTTGVTALSAHDDQLLTDAGFRTDLTASASADVDRHIRMQNLLHSSLTVDEAAHRLTVSSAQIEHLIATRALWAFSSGGKRLLPPAQFTNSGTVPHLQQIMPSIDIGAHPLTVQALLTQPQSSLEIDGQPVSVVEWLTQRAGADADIDTAVEILVTAQWASS